MKRIQWIKNINILLLFLTAGCVTVVSNQQQSSPVGVRSLTPLSTNRAETPTASSTPYPRPPTLTLTPITQLSASTPRSALSAEEVKVMVFDLLQNNGGCRLPCLWGLTPGKTDFHTFNDFLTQYKDLVTPDVYVNISDFGELGNLFLGYRKNNIHINVRFGYSINEDSKLEMLGLHGYSMMERGKDPDWLSPDVSPLYGDASFNQAFQYYLLPQILSNYGLPSQVLLAPFPDDPSRPDVKWHPFSLVLFYPDQRIFVEYISPREKRGNYFVSCPSKAQISLVVWSPESDLTLKDIVQKAGTEINELNIDYFRRVEEATSMSLNQFYQKFSDSQNTACLETPMELWLSP